MATASEQSKINNLKAAQLKLETDIKSIQDSQVELQKKGQDLDEEQIKNLNKKQKQIVKNLELQKTLEDNILNVKRSILDSLAGQERSISSISGIYSTLKKSEKDRLSILSNNKSITLSQVTTIQEMADITTEISELNKNQAIQKEVLLDKFGEQQNFLQKEIEMLNAKNGLTGDELANRNSMLSTLTSQQSILSKNLETAKTYTGLTKTQKQYLEDQIDVYDKIKNAVGGVLDTASLLWSTVGGKLGGALIGAGFLMEKLGHTAHKTGTFFTEMTLSATGLGFIFSDATEVATGLAKELGGIEHATFGAQLQTNLLANNLNIGADEATSLVGSFSRLNGNSTEVATSTIQAAKALAKANGVIPAQVMADMAGSTKAFADYGKEGGKNIYEAAIYAAKLGVTMDNLTTVTDSLLDFETSMTAELELGAMLGKSINLSKARQLAYDGKIGASVKEALSQMGGVAAFNKMDVFQKREAAAALGLSTDEMLKMVSNMDKLKDDGTIQLTTAQGIGKKFDYISEIMKGIATGPGGDFLKMLGSGAIAMGQMGYPLPKILSGVKDLSKWTGDVLKNVGSKAWSLLKGSGATESITGSAGEMVADKAGKMWGAGSPQGKMITTAKESMAEKLKEAGSEKLEGVGDTVTDKLKGAGEEKLDGVKDKLLGTGDDGGEKALGKGSITDKIGKINMTAVLKGAAALVIVAGAVWVFGKAVQQFADVDWNDVFKAIAGMAALTASVMAMGLLMSPPMGAIMLAGAAAMLVVAGAVWVLGKAIQEMAIGFTAMDQIGSTITSLVGQIGGIASLSVAFMGLAGSIGALGIASLLAMPALMGLGIAGTGIAVVSNLFNPKEKSSETTSNTSLNTESVSTYETEMIQLTKELIKAVSINRDVYLDKEKVTSIVKKTSDKHTSNSGFGLAGA